MKSEFDVIVVGARVAGSTLAYELARQGCEVLLVDENLFPSDALSTHNLYGNSLAMLKEMGVYDRLLTTGAPLYRRAHVNIEGAVIDGRFPGSEEESSCLCVRRLYFDEIMLDLAKAQPQVTVLEGFTVVGVIRESRTVAGIIGQHRDGRSFSFSARLVVGADGRRSAVREMVGSTPRISVPAEYAYYTAYVFDFAQAGELHSELYKSGSRTAMVYPTSDKQYVIGISFPLADAAWLSRFEVHPETALREFLEEGFVHTTLPYRFRSASPAGPIRGVRGYANDWHQGMGKGWALAGDALTFKDPVTGQGMHDALYGARLLAAILADYHPEHWRLNWELIGTVYQSALEKKLMSRFRLGRETTRSESVPEDRVAVYRMIGEDPEATRAFLGTYNYRSEPEEVYREIGRLLSAANALP